MFMIRLKLHVQWIPIDYVTFWENKAHSSRETQQSLYLAKSIALLLIIWRCNMDRTSAAMELTPFPQSGAAS